jgi:hypothetical protein
LVFVLAVARMAAFRHGDVDRSFDAITNKFVARASRLQRTFGHPRILCTIPPMAAPAQAASDDLLTCERCHGFYAVEVPPNGEPRVRCNSCGHIREVAVAPVPKSEEEGKWTVIGPDGKVMTFGSWDKLVESRHTNAVTPTAEERRPSASALLDITPTPIATLPKLALAELDSDPHLTSAGPNPSPAELAKSLAKSKGPEWAPTKAANADERSVKADELVPPSLVDDNSDDEPSPLSLRDAIADDDDAAPLSLRDAITVAEESAHEMLSLKDLTLIPNSDDIEIDSTPAPPARGALRTLPPTPSKKGEAAPPPTILVDEPEKNAATKSKADPPTKVDAKRADAPKVDAKKGPAKQADAAKSTPTVPKKTGASSETKREGTKREGKPVASARAAVAEDEPKRGWLLPTLAVAGVALVIWRMMAASPSKTDTPPQPTTTIATTTPTAAPTTTETTPPAPTAVTTNAPADTTATTTTTATTATATTTTAATAVAPTTTTEKKLRGPREPIASADPPAPVEKKAAAAADNGSSMSELLDRAGSARRKGDYATARDLYERVLRDNPGNVEANGGLGDVARAQGDLNGAKASYERALAASPSYGPAQLGLADTEWDLGNHAGAQRRYAQIVERLGDRAPERAKQRSTVNE